MPSIEASPQPDFCEPTDDLLPWCLDGQPLRSNGRMAIMGANDSEPALSAAHGEEEPSERIREKNCLNNTHV